MDHLEKDLAKKGEQLDEVLGESGEVTYEELAPFSKDNVPKHYKYARKGYIISSIVTFVLLIVYVFALVIISYFDRDGFTPLAATKEDFAPVFYAALGGFAVMITFAIMKFSLEKKHPEYKIMDELKVRILPDDKELVSEEPSEKKAKLRRNKIK